MKVKSDREKKIDPPHTLSGGPRRETTLLEWDKDGNGVLDREELSFN